MENRSKAKKTREEQEKEREKREKAIFERRQREEEGRAQAKLLERNEQEIKARGVRERREQEIHERERIIYLKRQREEEERAQSILKSNMQENGVENEEEERAQADLLEKNEQESRAKGERERREQEIQVRERIIYLKRQREEEERAQRILESNMQEGRVENEEEERTQANLLERNEHESRAKNEQETDQKEIMVYEKRQRKEEERTQTRMKKQETEEREVQERNTFKLKICEEHNDLDDTNVDLITLHLSRENREITYFNMDNEESEGKRGIDMKIYTSKCNTFSQKCFYCKDEHSITELDRILEHELDEKIKFKLLQSTPFAISSFYHYIKDGGKLHELILKKLPAEKWVEQSLICDLCNRSSQDGLVTLESLEEIRYLYGISATEKILFNLKKCQPLSILDISDILICILTSATYTPESSEQPDWLFKLKYNWIEQRLQQSSVSLFKNNLIDLLARSRLHLKVIEFIISVIGSDIKQTHLEEFLKFIQENNMSENDIFHIMKQNISKDSNRVKIWLYEMQMTFLVKSQTQINAENSYLLRINLATLMKQGYSYCTVKKLLNHDFITNENIFSFIEILNLIIDYQVDELVLDKIFVNIKQNQPNVWLDNVNRLVVDATFGKKQEYTLTELIDKIMETSSDYCNCTKNTLKAYYDKIKTASDESSKIFGLLTSVSEEIKSKPIKSWKREELGQWAKHIKEMDFDRNKICHQDLLHEIVAGIIQGIKLHYEISPRVTQILTVCLLLNPKKGRGCLAQVPTGEGKSLIVAMLATVYALLGKKVDIITTSTELSIPEANKQATFFELFYLTVGENSEITSKQEVYEKDIVYGTASDFQADILRSEFQGQPIRGDRGFGVVIVDEVDSMLFDQRTQSTRLSEKFPAMDHLELILANVWSMLNMTRRHLIKKDDKYWFIPEDFDVDEEGNVVTASNNPVEECGSEIEDPATFLKKNIEQIIERNLRSLTPDEENKKMEYEKLNGKSAALCKSLDHLQNELKLKIQESTNKNKQKAEGLTNEIEKLKISIEEINESNEQRDLLNKLDDLMNELQQVQEDMEKEVDIELYNKKKSKVEEQINLQEQLKKATWLEEYPVIDVPNHLLEFARQQIPNWVKSAIDALYCFQLNKHYAVEGGRIVPISYNDTGVFQPNMVWGNGLTQFLQMKEGLMIQPESVATNYLSTHGFFKRYDHYLYGVTGTLGESSTQEFFEKVYGTDQIKIPPHSYRVINHPAISYYQCKEFPSKILSDEKSWIEAICKTCLIQLKVKRSVLIICQYVSQVESLADKLVNVYNYPEDKIFKYTGRNDETFSKKDISTGEIVIATNIAGRGTDLSVNTDAEENGGLHVCITFLPSHFRVELQNVGRTARKGQRGSAQLLLHDSNGTDINILKGDRSKKEAISLKKAQNDVSKIKLQDQLFVKFCNFLGTLIPHLSQVHKMKEQMQLEDEYEREIYAVNDDSLEEAFNKHTEELQAERLALLEVDPQYAQYSSSEVVAAQSAIEKEIDMYRSTEYFNWKANHEKQIREALCVKWKGRISYDVLESFRLNIPLLREKSVNSSSLDYYDRLGVTEQWGIWLHITFSAEKIKSEKEIMESFKIFTENIKKQVDKGSQIQNPFYYTKKGNHKLHEKNMDNAIQCFEKAIEIDSRRSLYAHINLARAYLMKSSKKEMQVKAKQQYEEALNLIDRSYKPSLLELHAIIKQTEAGEKTSEHISHQLDVLQVVENHANTAIKVINDAQEKNMEVAVTNVESLKNIFKEGDESKDYSQAVDEAGVNGMTHLAILEAKQPTPWWSIVGVTLLGICQIAVGVLATIYTAGTLGEGLIAEGVSDMIAGIKGAITGSFSWATWAMEKAVSISISLICAGFNSIKRNLKAIKNIKPSAVCFKSGLKLATKQVGLALAKGVAKEALTYVSDLATENLLMEKIATIIEETVGKALTEAFEKNELIQRGLSIDVENQTNYYQKLFVREGMTLLTEKKGSNCIVTYLTSVWRGVLRRKAKNVPIDKLNTIIEELGNTSDPEKLRETAIKFTEKFLHLYVKQIERYRDLIEKDEYKINGKKHGSYQQTESDYKSQQHEQAFQQGTSPPERDDYKPQQHKQASQQQTMHSDNESQYNEQYFQQQTMPPECDVNEDNFGIHDTDSGKTYSTTQPKTSKNSSFYVPSNSKYLKKEFVIPITESVTNSVRENVVQPLQQMGTQTVLDYFSERTQQSINQQRRAYRREMRSRASNT